MLLLKEPISRREKGTKNVNFLCDFVLLLASIWAASTSAAAAAAQGEERKKKKHVLWNRGVCWKSELMKNAF